MTAGSRDARDEVLLRRRMGSLLLAATACLAAPLVAQDGERRAKDSLAAADLRIPLDRVAIPNLTEAIGGRFAGATMLRTNGLLSTGGVLRMRGRRSLGLPSEPALEIDGVLVPLAPPWGIGLGGETLPTISLLDLLDPHDIATVEVLPGLLSGVRRGSGLADGIVRITTRQGDRETRWSIGTEVETAAQPTRYLVPTYLTIPTESALFGDCVLANQAAGTCQADRLLRRDVSQDPLLSQLASGWRGRVRLGVRGALGRVRYAVSGLGSRGRGPLDLPQGERAALEADVGQQADRVARPDRLSELFARANVGVDLGRGVSMQLSGSTARQGAMTVFRRSLTVGVLSPIFFVDPRAPDSAAWMLERPATVYQDAVDRIVSRSLMTASAVWAPSSRSRAWLKVAGAWDRIAQGRAVDSMTVFGVRREGLDTLAYRDDLLEIELGGRHEFRTGRVGIAVEPVYQLRTRNPVRVLEQRVDGQVSASSRREDRYHTGSGALRVEVAPVDRRLVWTGVIRRDEARRLDVWEPAIWSYGTRLVWTGPLEIHASLAETRRRPGPDSPILTPVLPLGTVDTTGLTPERVSEVEIGARITGPGSRWWTSLLGYRQRVTDGWVYREVPGVFGAPPIRDMGNAGATLRNLGLEAELGAAVLATARWRAQVGAALSVTESQVGDLDAVWAGCHRTGQEAFPLCGRPLPPVVDANGDGLLSPDEFPGLPGSPEPVGPSMPTRTVGAWFDIGRTAGAGTVSLIGHFDYQGGRWSSGSNRATQCRVGLCREVNDPASSIEEQAAWFGGLGISFLRDASFGRMRELTLSWHTSSGLARWLGARRAVVGITARNLFVISRFDYWDPEVREQATEFAPIEVGPLPLSRTFTLKLAVDF